MTSYYDKKTQWEIGKPLHVANPDPPEKGTCGTGLHVAHTFWNAVRYQGSSSEYLQVEVQPQHIITADETSTRVSECLPVSIISAEEQNRLAKFWLYEANHPINPLFVNGPELPKDRLHTLLADWVATVWDLSEVPVWESVLHTIRNSMWSSVWGSVWNSVWYPIGDSVVGAVRNSVGDSIRDDSIGATGYIGSLFPSIASWKGISRPNPWASLRTLWLAGYLPSFDGSTWRLHRGPDAKVVFTH